MGTYTVSSTIVVEPLGNDNYANWSACMKNYLLAQDLWDIVEATSTEPPKPENDVVEFKAWRKKNAAALHAIQISCRVDILSQIKQMNSAKVVWDRLAKMFEPPLQVVKPVVELGKPSSGQEVEPSPIGANQLVEAGNSLNQPVSLAEGGGMVNNMNNMAEFEDLRRALQSSDWSVAKKFFSNNKNAVSAKISYAGETALLMALKAGHMHIAEELVGFMSEQDLEMRDNFGYTALGLAAIIGNTRVAEIMLRKNKKLVSIVDQGNFLPVENAVATGNIETTRFLYLATPLQDLLPEKGTHGSTLINQCIYNRSLDIALHLLRRCPSLAILQDVYGIPPLLALAATPSAFPSGSRLIFWKQWIYNRMQIRSACSTGDIRMDIKLNKHESDQVKINGSVVRLLHRLISNLNNLLGIKQIYEMKLLHVQSAELLRMICEHPLAHDLIMAAIFTAIKEGIVEIIVDIVRAKRSVLWTRDSMSRSIFMTAVVHRQAKIFSLIYGLDVKDKLLAIEDGGGNTIVHLAGILETSTQFDRITGAALQMQREMQWFKEMERIANSFAREKFNHSGMKPREVFTVNHKNLVKEGEKWMKETATSCTVVGALILTIMFAVAFTVPGGTDQVTGFPMFSEHKLFMIFIISDALSLFSSSTSVLMFLGILTSRYAEKDFLKSLPTKMIIGLSTLFFSIATMMTTFSTALFIMLPKQSWMFIPVICLASVPVSLFVFMQFPLLVDMFKSTYGPGIFDRKMKRWL